MSDKCVNDLMQMVADASKGADWSDLYIRSGAAHRSFFEDRRLDTVSSGRGEGVGFRIAKGWDTAYASSPRADGRSVSIAAAELARMTGRHISCLDIEGGLLGDPLALPSLDTSIFHAIDGMIRKESSLVSQVCMSFSSSVKSTLVVRPDGRVARARGASTRFTASVVVEKDGVLETGGESRAMGADVAAFASGDIARVAEDISRTALARALLMVDAAPCPAGVMNVVLDGTAGGTMIHEACGHSLEADIIQKDFSVFRDMMGERVADEIVTIVDDPTLPDMYGSYEYDDEGTPASRTVMIENGVLKTFLSDVISAKMGGYPCTGNGRRESYSSAPMPRMSNTFVVPGTSSVEEMIERAGDGLLVKKMGGGEVDPTSGNFVFYVSEGYMIKDGRVAHPVKGATLTGTGRDALMKIRAVGRELVLDPGVCGKSGQSVPVTDGQPTLLIEGLTVGGSDTEYAAQP